MPPTPYSAAARPILALLLLLGFAGAYPAGAQSADQLWAALRQPGHFVLLRHALAPGTGDPADFRVDDCGTQRNLSETGRNQARRIGDSFRANGIDTAAVYSSQWCRCLETARLLGLGEVRPLPSLNSFFGKSADGPAQTEKLRTEILDMDLSRPAILVTHQVNVTALSRVYPSSGEMVVMRRTADRQIEVVGRLRTE